MEGLTPAEWRAAEALMELRMARPQASAPAAAERGESWRESRRVAVIRELRRIASHNGPGVREL